MPDYPQHDGTFYLLDDPPPNCELSPAFYALAAHKRGFVQDPRSPNGPEPGLALEEAGLAWRIEHRPVFAPTARGEYGSIPAPRYRALIRTDTDAVVSVVTTKYRSVEHATVASTALHLAQHFDRANTPDSRAQHSNRDAALLVAVALGDSGEEALFGIRVFVREDCTLWLLATNSHGGGDAVRFRLVDVDHESGAMLVGIADADLLTAHHQGDLEGRLRSLPHTPRGLRWIPRYLDETSSRNERLSHRLFTPTLRLGLVQYLWPQQEKIVIGGDGARLLHPGEYLMDGSLANAANAWEVYVAICAYIDQRSEARERGDATRDRARRLAYGAGNRLKRASWTWLLHHE